MDDGIDVALRPARQPTPQVGGRQDVLEAQADQVLPFFARPQVVHQDELHRAPTVELGHHVAAYETGGSRDYYPLVMGPGAAWGP